MVWFYTSMSVSSCLRYLQNNLHKTLDLLTSAVESQLKMTNLNTALFVFDALW